MEEVEAQEDEWKKNEDPCSVSCDVEAGMPMADRTKHQTTMQHVRREATLPTGSRESLEE